MSGAAKPGKTIVGRLLDVLGLGVVFALPYAGVTLAPGHSGAVGVIGALGFLLLAGTLMSELVGIIGVPHLSGYLLAGILAGPHVLNLVDESSAARLQPVNALAIALIALSGGAELRIASLRSGLRTLVSATVLQTGIGIVAVAGIFVAIRPAFVRELPLTAVIGVGILWGCVAITRSPSAALGIVSQTRAKGPLARFTVAFVMSSDVVVVIALAAAITIARPLVDPDASFSFAAFGHLGREIIGSVAMGTTLGILLAVYMKLVARQLLVVLIALGFGATEVLRYLDLDVMLTFIVAGFVVENLSKQGEKFREAIEATGGVVYVVFFAGAGADLNVPLLREYWPVALLLCVSRVAVTFLTSKLSSRIGRDPPNVRKWGWAPLISQAGVAIGISAVIAKTFPSFGPTFRDIAIACIALNEMVGPVVFKFALDRAKETEAPTPALSESEDVVA